MNFKVLSFHEFENRALYRCLQLRSEVFVVEQDCVYLDMDDLDQDAHHVIGLENNEIHACTRIIAPGVKYEDYACIGRVITSQQVRSHGYGRPLMNYSIDACKKLYPTFDIKISAQAHLDRFYGSMGFVQKGEAYLEDGIPHISMVLEKK